MRIGLFFLTLLFFLFFFNIDVLAENRAGITVSPFIIEEVISPGENFKKVITVTNNSDQEQIFRVHFEDFKAKGEFGEALLLPFGSSEKFSLIDWINFQEREIRFNPKQSRQVPISFYVPEKIAPGGYYAAIVFTAKYFEVDQKYIEEGMFVDLSHQVGVLVFLNSPEGSIEKAKIIEFKTDRDYYAAPFNVNFITRIENLGDVHIKPIGSIKIEDFRGREVAVLPFNKDGLNILPESIRRFEETWQGSLGFGRYKASLVFNFGTPIDQGGMGMQMVSTETYFWIIPWNIVMIFGLIVLFVLIIVILKQYKKLKNLKIKK